MKKKFNLNASVFEYNFARMVEDTNIVLFNAGRRNNLIMASHGRALHDCVLSFMEADGVTPETVRFVKDANDARPVFEDYFIRAIKESYGSSLRSTKIFENRAKGYANEYQKLSGIPLSENNGSYVLSSQAQSQVSFNGYMPISPFDNNYAYRTNVLNAGTRILFASTSDMVKYENQELKDVHIDEKTEKDVVLYTRQKYINGRKEVRSLNDTSLDYQSEDDISYRSAGTLYVNDDALGLARLKPYMTDAEYKVACTSMMNVPESERMSPQGMDRAVFILQFLSDNGVPYTVKPDMNIGQLKAEISNTKQDIRLTDLHKNEQYIGRGYRDGVSMYMSPSSTDRAKNNAYVMTLADTELLVRYMLGESPERPHVDSSLIDSKIGSTSKWSMRKNSTYVSKTDKKGVTFHTLAGYSSSQLQTLGNVPLTINTGNDHHHLISILRIMNLLKHF